MDDKMASHHLDEEDFADQLPPGFRFNPKDCELIQDFLNAKIQSRKLPIGSRVHEVNIYNHHPEQLAKQYRANNEKWYFLTRNEKKGDVCKRSVGDFGTWKAKTKTQVYDSDDDDHIDLGIKRLFAFHEKNGKKTSWRMHEYVSNLPSPLNNKLNDWALYKMFNTEENQEVQDVAEDDTVSQHQIRGKNVKLFGVFIDSGN